MYESERERFGNAIKKTEKCDCPYRYNDFDFKRGTLDVYCFCQLKKGKLCSNKDGICWYAKDKS